MKKKDNYFLDKHKKWMETGFISKPGLCHAFKESEVFNLFGPSHQEGDELESNGMSRYVWGDGRVREDMDKDFKSAHKFRYTPLRQTIVLFCHEILNS
jgi:hypothetical protein